MRHRALVLTLLLALSACLTADAQTIAPIPIAVDMDGRIAITVRINGAGPYRLRLDTGASRTVVSTALADELGLPAAGQSRTITHTGESHRPLVRAYDLALGPTADVRVQELLVLALPAEAIDRTGRVVGVLGQDVLARWVYTIDYRARQLLVAPETAPCGSGAVRLPLVRSAGGMVTPIVLGGASGLLRLVPDTGADRLVLFGQMSHALPALSLIETVRVRSITGEGSARLVRLGPLEVAGIAVGELEALLLDARPSSGAMGDGLLPLHLFGRVTFDVARSSLWIEPRR
jgi:predicted aspartyl protease